MLAMHTCICTFSHALHLTRDQPQINQCVSHHFLEKRDKIYDQKYFVKKTYDSIAGVGETGVWLRADFQSGSRVLKKVF